MRRDSIFWPQLATKTQYQRANDGVDSRFLRLKRTMLFSYCKNVVEREIVCHAKQPCR